MRSEMRLIDLVKERRSVRRFQEKSIPDEMMTDLLEAVRWSPSWGNTQCWEVVVVKDNQVKDQLKEVVSPKNPATKAVASAPVVFALCGKKNRAGFYKDTAVTKFGEWMMFDLGIAAQSLCLTAHALGLGSVIVGSMDHDAAGKILKMPSDCEMVVLIPVGFPEKISSPPKRKDVNEFTHSDCF